MSVQRHIPVPSEPTSLVSEQPLVAELFVRKQSLISHYLDQQRVQQYAQHLQQGLSGKQPSIMVYGLYSAGKSTIINALMGKMVAKEGRNPTTERIAHYQWGGLDINDTPGVDAPPEHEQVTQQQLERSDLVLFVVSASAALDDQHTYTNILRLVSRQRKVMLVVNWRRHTPCSQEQIAVNDSLHQQLQQQAKAMGFSDSEVLAQVPIHWINAKMGFQGKTEQKPLLLNDSGLPAFEQALKHFINETDHHQQESRLAADLVRLVQDAQQSLQLRMDALGTSGYQHLANRLQEEQSRIRGQIQQLLRRQSSSLAAAYKQLAQSGTDEYACEQQLNDLITGLCQEVEQQLQVQLEQTAQVLEQLADQLDRQQTPLRAEVELPEGIRPPEDEQNSSAGGGKTPHLLPEGTMKLLVQQIKKEHLVEVMKQAKKLIPILFKGIGQKTMEKWAETILGKTRIGGPWVQVGIQVLSGLWQHYQQEKQLQQEQDSLVRFHEQVRAGAEQLAGQYLQSMENCIDQVLLQSLQPAQRFIEDSLQAIDQQSATLGQDNGQLSSLINQLQLHYKLDSPTTTT